MRVAFCVSGRGSLFKAAVERPAAGAEPVLLVTEPKADAVLSDVASAHAIPHVRLAPTDRAAFDAALATALDTAAPDLVVLTFDRIVPADVVRRYAGRMLNVHPALLPAFAGTHGIERTLASGARFGGATIHEVVEAVDAGPIIAQAVVPIDPTESPDVYGRRMYALLEPMFLQVLAWYAAGRVEHDEAGRVIVRGATYGVLPISPALEP